MGRIVKYIVSRTYRPWLLKYLSKTRKYSYQDIRLEIPPQVFHPGFFHSTKLLLRYLGKEELQGKTLLEPGAGSGLVSMWAVKKGATVTSTDINPVAVEYLKINAEKNQVDLDIIFSDLFERIPEKPFDLVVINPPYYRKNPSSARDYAWYCGENGEYFERLFNGLEKYIHDHSSVYMVLSDVCDLGMVEALARKNRFSLHCVYSRKTLIEENYIFKIELSNGSI